MRCATLIIATAVVGTSYAQVRPIAEALETRPDRIVVEVTREFYGIKEGASPLDRSSWIGPFGGTDTHRVKIVRPFALCEYLRDEPIVGYVPVRESVTDRGYVCQHVRPVPRIGAMAGAYTVFTVVEGSVQAGTLKGNPLLQFLDLHMHDSTVPFLSAAGMIENGTATAVRADGGRTIYQAYVEMQGYGASYEIEVNERGTPVYVRTTLDLHENPELQPITYEQYVLSTREFDGSEIADEGIIVVENRNVQRERNLHHYRICSVTRDEALQQGELRIEPALRSSIIHRYRADGGVTTSCYDATGSPLKQQNFLSGPAPLEDAEKERPAARPKKSSGMIAPIVGGLLLCAMAAIHFMSRRRNSAPS